MSDKAADLRQQIATLQARLAALENDAASSDEERLSPANGQRYQLLLEAITDSVWVLDHNLRYTLVNEAALRTLQMPREQVVGQTMRDLFPDIEQSPFYQLYRRVIATQTPDTVLDAFTFPDGRQGWFELRAYPLPDGVIGIASDVTNRMQAQQQANFMAQLLDNVRESIIATDLDGRVTFWSNGAEQLYGYQAEEVTGQAVTFIVDPSDEAAEWERIEQARQAGRWRGEYRQRRKDGSVFWADAVISRVDDEAGQPMGLVGIDRDITASKTAQETLQWELTVNESLAALTRPLLAPDSTIVEIACAVLEEAQRLTGSAHGYVSEVDPRTRAKVGHTLTRMMAACSVPEEAKYIAFPVGEDGTYNGLYGYSLNTLESFYTNDPASHPAAAGTPEGHVPLERFLSVPVLLGGELVGQIALANADHAYHDRDLVTIQRLAEYYALALQRKHIEDVLRQERDRTRQYLDIAAALIVSLRPDGTIELINSLGCQLLGYTEDELIGQDWFDTCLPAQDRAEIRAVFAQVMSGDFADVEQYENPIVTRSGEERLISWHNTLLYDEQGRVTGMLSSGQDITERRAAQAALRDYSERLEEMVETRTAELRQAQDELVRQERLAVLGQLAGGVGHELRNPLGVISNAVYYLQMVLADADATTHEYLDIIGIEVRDAESTIADLLNFSRRRDPAREWTDAALLVETVLQKHPPPPGITLAVEVPASLPPLLIDPHQVILVLTNLIINGYQAMQDQAGTLSVKGWQEDGSLHLAVTDEGIGIPPENLDKLFEPLFTTKTRGIGLGLAVSRLLAEANAGRITVASEAGPGSTFTLIFPLNEPTHLAQPDRAKPGLA